MITIFRRWMIFLYMMRFLFYISAQGVVTLNPERKSAPDSIAVFLCVKFVICFFLSRISITHTQNLSMPRGRGIQDPKGE